MRGDITEYCFYRTLSIYVRSQNFLNFPNIMDICLRPVKNLSRIEGVVKRGPCTFLAKRYIGTFIYLVCVWYVCWNDWKWLEHTTRTPTLFHCPQNRDLFYRKLWGSAKKLNFKSAPSFQFKPEISFDKKSSLQQKFIRFMHLTLTSWEYDKVAFATKQWKTLNLFWISPVWNWFLLLKIC